MFLISQNRLSEKELEQKSDSKIGVVAVPMQAKRGLTGVSSFLQELRINNRYRQKQNFNLNISICFVSDLYKVHRLSICLIHLKDS